MAISTKLLRFQIALLKSWVNHSSIELTRAAQTKIGELMAVTHRSKVFYEENKFPEFYTEMITPKKREMDGIILYLHGGGYVSGDIEYAKSFGTILAAKNGIRVFCVAYRLAPEHPFPAALEDAVQAYQYLLANGYTADQIILCGESAGGGLIYALSLKLKELHIPLPAGFIAISPWVDLTASGESYQKNCEIDPSITKERLQFYASHYTSGMTELQNPFVSPLFGDLTLLPPSLIFVGGDEIMLDDAVALHQKLIDNGNQSDITISPHMWHAYILFGVNEAKKDHDKILGFLKESLHE